MNIFNSANLAHFENCAIAVKKPRKFASDYYFEQQINEIQICSKIGYHRNVCAMLGYVSNEQNTYLLLELAQSSLLNALKGMKENEALIDSVDTIRYLRNIAIQIAHGMVNRTEILLLICLRTLSVIHCRKKINSSRFGSSKHSIVIGQSSNGWFSFLFSKKFCLTFSLFR